MEVPGGSQNKLLVCLHELLGTCWLFTTVNMTATKSYQAVAVGLSLMVNIILLGPISNSHVNPAVTLGVLVREAGEERSKGKMAKNVVFAIMIMLSQILGAIVGAFVVALLRYSDDGLGTNAVGVARLCGQIGAPNCAVVDEANAAKMLLAEFIGTFLFVNVNVNIIFNNGSKEIILNSMIIGFALILGLMVAAPISGGAVNPAVGAVLPVFQHIIHDVPVNQMPIHIFGPYLGGLFAGLFQLVYK